MDTYATLATFLPLVVIAVGATTVLSNGYTVDLRKNRWARLTGGQRRDNLGRRASDRKTSVARATR